MLINDRLITEYRNLRKNRKYLFYAKPQKNFKIWDCGFPGPDGELYGGSYYSVTFTFPSSYPHEPPKVKFKNKVYHPNVYTNGDVCLDIIQGKWKPSMTVMSVLMAMQTFLETPNIKSPANTEAAYLYRTKFVKYCETVKSNIKQYHSKFNFTKQ